MSAQRSLSNRLLRFAAAYGHDARRHDDGRELSLPNPMKTKGFVPSARVVTK